MTGGKFGALRGESFDEMSTRAKMQNEAGARLARARFDRGQRLTENERAALVHDSRFGSDGYPVRKLGRGFIYEHAAASSAGIFKTKREAICSWELMLAIYREMARLEVTATAVQS